MKKIKCSDFFWNSTMLKKGTVKQEQLNWGLFYRKPGSATLWFKENIFHPNMSRRKRIFVF